MTNRDSRDPASRHAALLALLLPLAACSAEMSSEIARGGAEVGVDGGGGGLDGGGRDGAAGELAAFRVCSSPGMQLPRTAWAPTGERFAVSSAVGTVRVYATFDGHELFAVNGLGRELSAPVWSPDGAQIAVANHKVVHVLRAGDGVELFSVPDTSVFGSPPIYSRDATWLGVLELGQIHRFRAADGGDAGAIDVGAEPRRVLRAAAFSTDGALLAVADDAAIRLLRVADGALLHVWPAIGVGLVNDLEFSSSAGVLLASVREASLVRGWRLSDYLPIELDLSSVAGRLALAMDLSSDGAWLALSVLDAGTSMTSIAMWRLAVGGQALPQPELAWRIPTPSGSGAQVVLSPDGRSVLVGDETVTLRAVVDGAPRLGLDERVSGERGAVLSRDGQLLLTGGTRSVDLWRSSDGKHLARFTGGSGDAALVRGDTTVAVAQKSVISLRLVTTGVETGYIDLTTLANGAAISALALSPDGRTLAVALGLRVALVPLDDTGHPRLLVEALPAAATQLTWSPGGDVLALGLTSRALNLVRVSDGVLVGATTSGLIGPTAPAFSPDGKLLLIASYPPSVVPVADPKHGAVSLRPYPRGPAVALAWTSGDTGLFLDDGAGISAMAIGAALPGGAGVDPKKGLPTTNVSTWSPGWIGTGTLAASQDGLSFAALIPWNNVQDLRLFCRR